MTLISSTRTLDEKIRALGSKHLSEMAFLSPGSSYTICFTLPLGLESQVVAEQTHSEILSEMHMGIRKSPMETLQSTHVIKSINQSLSFNNT